MRHKLPIDSILERRLWHCVPIRNVAEGPVSKCDGRPRTVNTTIFEAVYQYLKHDGTVPTCFNQSKASISFDYIP